MSFDNGMKSFISLFKMQKPSLLFFLIWRTFTLTCAGVLFTQNCFWDSWDDFKKSVNEWQKEEIKKDTVQALMKVKYPNGKKKSKNTKKS